ncbi:MAG: radical SAM family heme chaperone HemW [Planctomycetota bacterium]
MTMPSYLPSLYVHIPFCRSRCAYCDFYSTVLSPPTVPPLLDALLNELEQVRLRYWPACQTIFIGGGTPTVLPAVQLERLLQGCRRLTRPSANIEFTVEANPATVDRETAEILATAGVNRVSIGAQSFEPAELRVLGRTHQPEQVGETVAICRGHDIKRISLDLIFAIPGQTLKSWRTILQAAVALEPEHLSCYGLTYEPGTRLAADLRAGRVTRVEHDLEADMYEATIDDLAAAGYQQYEISNFCHPGGQCRHNLTYWHNESYLGIGPSASGYIDGVRYKNVADIAEYIQSINSGRSPRCEEECLSPTRSAGETAMLALRLIEGLNRRRFADRFGHDPVEHFAAAVERHVADGLLEVTDEAIRLTRRGLLLANTVIADLI